jgi:hypothetical protein
MDLNELSKLFNVVEEPANMGSISQKLDNY